MTRSALAFLFTAERLFQANEKVFFWTFTFNVIHSDAESSLLFSEFLNHLRKVLKGDWGGVKVAELHKEHGVHFHALINRRLAVDIVRRVAKCHGIGRIHVERAWLDQVHPPKTRTHYAWNGQKWIKRQEVTYAGCTSPEYLAKYLRKQLKGPISQNPETGKTRSLRKWDSFGQIKKTRVKDIVNDSPEWIFRRENHLPFLSWRYEPFLHAAWLRGPEVLKSAWFAAKQGDMQTVIQLSQGQLETDGLGVHHQAANWTLKQLAKRVSGNAPF